MTAETLIEAYHWYIANKQFRKAQAIMRELVLQYGYHKTIKLLEK